MSLNNRLFLAAASCLLLSNCGLINTALRLAPLLMLVEDGKAGAGTGKTLEMRARQVDDKGVHGLQPQVGSPSSGLALSR